MRMIEKRVKTLESRSSAPPRRMHTREELTEIIDRLTLADIDAIPDSYGNELVSGKTLRAMLTDVKSFLEILRNHNQEKETTT